MNGKQAFKTLRKVGITLILALPVSIYISQCSINSKPIPDDERAVYACMGEIKDNLNDPDSAEFDYHSSYALTTAQKNVWAARIVLRAKNAFNAKIRTAYICTVRKVDNEMTVMALGLI